MKTGSPQPAPYFAAIIDAAGTRAATSADLRESIVAKRFFWLDVSGGSEAERTDLLNQLGLQADDTSWAQRFGQAGRMLVEQRRLRAVTWLVGHKKDIVEVHLVAYAQFIVTLRNGESDGMEEVRRRFSARIGYLEQSHYQATGILLQLLLSTLELAIVELDSELADIQNRLSSGPLFEKSALVTWHDRWHSRWTHFERYRSVVRSAVVGIEVVPGMDTRGAAELNDYADQVDDIEHRLQERNRSLANIMRDYAASVAEYQSKQISRLTVVSVIFLPMTFLAGLFGMNFNWMINHIGSESAFIVLGLAVPAFSALASLAVFQRQGLLFVKKRRARPL